MPNYEDAGVCGWKKGGAIQVVTHDIQNVRRKRRFHTLGSGVCVGSASLWIGGGVLGEFCYTLVDSLLISAGNFL